MRTPSTAGWRRFDRRGWQVTDDGTSVTLRLVSPEGDQGFPGELEVAVRSALSGPPEGARLDITLAASTDAATPVNLTNHAYINLGGVTDSLSGDRGSSPDPHRALQA